MKREKIKTYVVDERGRMEDLSAKVVYRVEFTNNYAFTGKRVFVGEYPELWPRDSTRKKYLAFNLDGSFFQEVDRFEMDDFDVKMARDDKKYKRMIEQRKKLIEDIQNLQAECRAHKERSEVNVRTDFNS